MHTQAHATHRAHLLYRFVIFYYFLLLLVCVFVCAFVCFVCSQPRRISAIGLAERVSSERCEPVGGTVGYRIRLENKDSAQTRCEF